MLEEDYRCSTNNPLFAEVLQPGIGKYLMPGVPHQFNSEEREHARGPLLGEHTDQILSEDLGLNENQIGKLYEQGIISGINE